MPSIVRNLSRLVVVILFASLLCLCWRQPHSLQRSKRRQQHRITETLVVACKETDDMSWLENHFAVQNVTVSRSKKGREAGAYLNYIVDNYHSLTDVTIFIHNQDHAWHNTRLFNLRMSRNLARLSRAFVFNEGYFNLRCDWEPGCPARLNLTSPTLGSSSGNNDETDPEVEAMRMAWSQIHPDGALPAVLAQPCCSQFAASRKRIHAIPLARWIHFRDWVVSTQLSDWAAGRVWEYTWQYLLAGDRVAIWCPSEMDCFCAGYNICFGSKARWQTWKRLEEELEDVGRMYMAVIGGGDEDVDLKKRLLGLEKEKENMLAAAIIRGQNEQGTQRSWSFSP